MGKLMLKCGNILDYLENIDAIVNSTNKYMSCGSGVCGAIYKKANKDKLEEYCRNNFSRLMEVNEVRITPGFDLGIDIIHIYCPKYYESENPIEDLEQSYISIFKIAKGNDYKKIVLVGHSMGGVLATSMALKYQDYIDRLILIDPAFEYLIMKDGKLKIFSSIVQAIKIFKDKANKERSSQVFRCTPKAIKEFRLLVKEHKDDIYKVKCPVMFLHGDHDYVVPIEAIRNIYEKIDNKNKKIIEVKNGSHWILSTKLEDDIYNKIKDFLNK